MPNEPSADDWSFAIASLLTEGRAPGDQVYMDVDEDTLDHVGREHFGLPSGFEAFRNAVRRQLKVPTSDGWLEAPLLSLPGVRELPDGPPFCTAFLALLAVCAGRYGDRIEGYEGAATGNYFFPWLRKLLGGTPCSNRYGLGEFGDDRAGAPEIQLWAAWVRYLRQEGYANPPTLDWEGPWKNVGRSLDQVLLTPNCRRYLLGMESGARRILVRGLKLRQFDRVARFLLQGAPKHLKGLLEHGANNPALQEAILSALEGAPAGMRPQRANLGLVRIRAGEYELMVHPPSRWERCRIMVDGHSSDRRLAMGFGDLRSREFSFGIGDAEERVDWAPGDFVRFLEPSGTSMTAWASGVPELGEEHALLVRAALLPSLRQAKDRGECDWEDETCGGEWVDLADFRLMLPCVRAASVTLRVRHRGGLIFEGGVRTGERDRRIMLFHQRRGGLRAAEAEGRAEIGGRALTLNVERAVPLPDELGPGEYAVNFGGQATRFELVDWRKVLRFGEPVPDDWIGGPA